MPYRMKPIVTAERVCLIAHIAAMTFGLAGLLLVLPHPEFILRLPALGQQLFQWSMAGGGVVYILLGAMAVGLHGYQNLGVTRLLGFLLPAVLISLGSELLGTSTGFPFGHYAYLSGLGYKIAGLVPFTIPLSWFYMGLSAFLLAYAGLQGLPASKNLAIAAVTRIGIVLLGAVLLTSWDFVLDPAMSQTPVPFWQFQQAGLFFGMPYRNLAGWAGTGAVFMGIATFLWHSAPTLTLSRSQLGLPLLIYLVNFAFGAIITVVSLDQRFLIPTAIGVVLGVVPALILWWLAPQSSPTSESSGTMPNQGILPTTSPP
jgi:uncharacterized membrane protein